MPRIQTLTARLEALTLTTLSLKLFIIIIIIVMIAIALRPCIHEVSFAVHERTSMLYCNPNFH